MLKPGKLKRVSPASCGENLPVRLRSINYPPRAAYRSGLFVFHCCHGHPSKVSECRVARGFSEETSSVFS